MTALLKRILLEKRALLIPLLLGVLGGVFSAAGYLVYQRLPDDAIDYTVMEKTERLLLVPAGFDWVDVGSWTELADLIRADADGNVVEGESVLVGTSRSFISSETRLVAAIGLEDMIVVESAGAILICPKSRAQDVKKIVEALRRSGKSQYL